MGGGSCRRYGFIRGDYVADKAVSLAKRFSEGCLCRFRFGNNSVFLHAGLFVSSRCGGCRVPLFYGGCAYPDAPDVAPGRFRVERGVFGVGYRGLPVDGFLFCGVMRGASALFLFGTVEKIFVAGGVVRVFGLFVVAGCPRGNDPACGGGMSPLCGFLYIGNERLVDFFLHGCAPQMDVCGS